MIFSDVQWVVQENMLAEHTRLGLRAACKSAEVEYHGLTIIPFDDTPILSLLPTDKRQKKNIYYACTNLGRRLSLPDNGFFYDPARFTMSQYCTHYGYNCLNNDAFIGTIDECLELPYADNDIIFVRPDGDTKLFTGCCMLFDDLREWWRLLVDGSDEDVARERILVGPALNIVAEFRCFMVDGKCISISQYRKRGLLSYERMDGNGATEIHKFCEKMASIYQPHPVFVMDVAYWHEPHMSFSKPYVLECGCFNWAGIYDHDLTAIVRAVSAYRGRLET